MNIEAQRAAFGYLRDEARSANLAGDGFRVNHLAAIALAQFHQLAERKRLGLTLDDVKWACILPLHWLLHEYMLHHVGKVRGDATKAGSASASLQHALKTYFWFVEQPLAILDKGGHLLKDFSFDWCRASDAVEDGVLITHLLELVWWSDRQGSDWLAVADDWLGRCPGEHREALEEFRDRLFLQARFTRPRVSFIRVAADELPQLPERYPLAKLWGNLLNGEAMALDDEIETLVSANRPNEIEARAVFDAHHWNRFVGNWGEEQAVGLTRRMLHASESPMLSFHQARQARRSALLGELYLRNSEDNAIERFSVFSLVRSEALTALRLWSWSDWADAIRAESHAAFEVCRWIPDKPGWAVFAILLSVRASSLKEAKDSAEFRRALSRLEFAPTELLAAFVAELLNTYLRQKRAAWDALEGLADLIPESCWEAVAGWQLEYLAEHKQGKDWGPGIMTLSLWANLLPRQSAQSPLWQTLQPEALRLAAIPWVWRHEGRGFFLVWLEHAPLSLAIELGDVIAEVPDVDHHDQEGRAMVLGNAELQRPELSGRYRERLFAQARDIEQRSQLWPLMTEEQKADLKKEAKPHAVHALEAFLKHAAPRAEPTQYHLPSGCPRLVDIVAWEIADLPLVEAALSAINNPGVMANCLPHLLDCLSCLVANGPSEFADRILPEVHHWLQKSPTGRLSKLSEMTGPFANVRLADLAGTGTPNLIVELGRVVSALLDRLGNRASDVFERWLRELAKPDAVAAVPNAVELCLLHSSSLSSERGQVCLECIRQPIHHVIARADVGPKDAQTLAVTLNKFSTILAKSSESHPAPGLWEPLLASIDDWMPSLAGNADARVRQAVAFLAKARLNAGTANPALVALVERLKGDNRARVRHAAEFGIPLTTAD